MPARVLEGRRLAKSSVFSVFFLPLRFFPIGLLHPSGSSSPSVFFPIGYMSIRWEPFFKVGFIFLVGFIFKLT